MKNVYEWILLPCVPLPSPIVGIIQQEGFLRLKSVMREKALNYVRQIY